MNVKDAIKHRRSLRSLKPVTITRKLIKDLAMNASLAPSCYNHQPWRFIFVYRQQDLIQLSRAISSGNAWTKAASMIVVVLSKKEYDCIIKNREYYLFDTGISTGFMILRATELNLVAHPIAGYNEQKVKEYLHIPEDFQVITLICIGAKSTDISSLLNEKMIKSEKNRPRRKKINEFSCMNSFSRELDHGKF